MSTLPLHPKSAPGAAMADVDPRTRLLHAALALFAEKGFAKTSTRQIVQAAGTNIAAIRYYFGDKAGLYKAVFREPLGDPHEAFEMLEAMALPLESVLGLLIAGLIEPMKHGELVRLSMRLHYREMLEPTSVWQEEIDRGIRPAHAALERALCRHLGLAEPDLEVQRLAVAIVAMPIHLCVCRDIVDAVSPKLLADHDAIDLTARRLNDFAMALVAAEAARRARDAEANAGNREASAGPADHDRVHPAATQRDPASRTVPQANP